MPLPDPRSRGGWSHLGLGGHPVGAS